MKSYLIRTKMNKYCCILLFLSVLYSCKKDSNNSRYHFTFQVGSKPYSVDSVFADTNSSAAFVIRNIPTQSALNANEIIGVSFVGFNYSATDTSVIGSYTCTQTAEREICESALSIYFPNDANDGQFYLLSNGLFTITITEKNDQYISGTFQGQMDAIIISNGSFKVPYNQ